MCYFFITVFKYRCDLVSIAPRLESLGWVRSQNRNVIWRQEGAPINLHSVLIWPYLGIWTVHAVVRWRSRSLAESAYCVKSTSSVLSPGISGKKKQVLPTRIRTGRKARKKRIPEVDQEWQLFLLAYRLSVEKAYGLVTAGLFEKVVSLNGYQLRHIAKCVFSHRSRQLSKRTSSNAGWKRRAENNRGHEKKKTGKK